MGKEKPDRAEMINVFISYTHDAEDHQRRVIQLAQRLREDGLNCWIDAFVNGHPEEGWDLWMERQIENADFVLLVCTEVYRRRFRGEESAEKGHGAAWESLLTRDHIYSTKGWNRKFIPVFFEGASLKDIPGIFRYRYTHYKLMDQYDALYRYLTDQSKIVPKPIGARKTYTSHKSWPIEEVNQGDEFANSIKEHMAELNRKVKKLTQEQYRVIQQLRGFRQVRITGCAGSGKTLVAAEKAIRLSDAGLNTLFLCHNPLLANHIERMTQGSGVRVESFDKWISTLTGGSRRSLGVHWTNYEEPGDDLLAQAFDTVLEKGPYYDAIIVAPP